MSDQVPRRLLVRGVNWLGDAVMTTPALMRLRAALPDSQITLATRGKLADLWKSHPALDEVFPIETGESVWAVGRRLRTRNFDAALILPNSPRSALEVWSAGIPRRIGYRRPWRNWFLTEAIPTRPGHRKMNKRGVAEIKRLVAASDGGPASRSPISEEAHQTHEYLHLAATLGAVAEPVDPVLGIEPSEVDVALSKFNISRDGVWLGLNAGAEYGPAKRWPKERFIAAAREIQSRTQCGCLIFGGQGDVNVAGEIAGEIRNASSLHGSATAEERQSIVRNVAGRTSLRELMALLAHCRVLLTNDTGPMHVAAALGVPVVVPFGSTSPELTGPGMPGDSRHRLIRSDAPCSPCFLRECPIDFRCMNDLRVASVVDAVIDLVSAS